MRIRRAAVLALFLLAAGGCSAHPAGSGGGPGAGTASTPPAAPPVVSGRAPGCSTATAAAPELTRVRTSLAKVAGYPFGVAESPDGRWAFAALTSASEVSVLRNQGAGVPVPVRAIHLPLAQPIGMTISRDGRYLLAADGNGGATVIDARRAEQGTPGAVLGTLSGARGGGAIEVAVTPDDRFAVVSLEGRGALAVYNLRRALTRGFGQADFVGLIPVGIAPVGLAVSPDGRWLYSTSEIARGVRPPGRPGLGGQGSLAVISLRRAGTSPGSSVVATVTAGCNPVRVVTSADGTVIWVTARESDSLLAFSAAHLRTGSAHALLAAVRVGSAPVGLALVRGGTRIVVADSDRFQAPGAVSTLAVISVPAALAGRPALLGYLRAGGFPREMALTPGGRTLLVGNFASQQLETVDLTSLP